MAYDTVMAARVRDLVPEVALDMSERSVFGARCWTLGGNMAFGVHDQQLLVRLGADGAAEAVKAGTAQLFDPMGAGKPMANYVLIDEEDIAEDDELLVWLQRAVAFTATLPEK